MFTTAPVHLENGTWSYDWDTSIILGTLKPGKYTVYVVDSPVDRQRFIKGNTRQRRLSSFPRKDPSRKLRSIR